MAIQPDPVAAPQMSETAKKFGRFLLVGGLCTGLQYLLLILLVEQLAMPAAVSSTIGYAVSSGLNYYLNYSFTFNSAANHRTSVPRFLLVCACGLLLNALITYVGTSVYGVHYLVAQVVATVATLLWNFLANLRWTF